MKLLFVVPAYEPAWAFGGVVRCISNLCQGMVANGDDVTVYTINADGLHQSLPVPIAQQVDNRGVATFYFSSTFGPHSVWDSRGLAKALRQTVSNFDIVYMSAVWQFLGFETANACDRNGIPLVFGAHGSLNRNLFRSGHLKKSLYWQLLLKRALRLSAAIHYTTAYERNGSRATGAPSFLAPNAVTIDEFVPKTLGQGARTKYGLPVDRTVLLSVGRIHPIKRLDLVIQSLQHAKDTCLAIVGPADTDYAYQCRTLTEDLGLTEQVIWLGYQTGEDLVSIYNVADCYVSLSNHENFGMTIGEAMACGLPFIVNENAGIWHEVRDDNVGVAVASTPEDLAGAICSLRRDPNVWQERGSNAQEVARSRFAPARVAGLMHRAFEDILTGVQSLECHWDSTFQP